MKPVHAIALATVYGVTVRILFGFLGNILEIMSLSFFVLAPLAFGFLTIILLPRKKLISSKAAFFLPWLTCLVILIVTVILGFEGAICWAMAYPLFAVVAGLGGVIANSVRKRKQVDIDDIENYEKWTQPDKLGISLLLLFPFIFGWGEGERLQTRKDMVVTQSIILKTTPSGVMKTLAAFGEIMPEEKHFSFSRLLGFPRHLKTTLDTMAVGGKRDAVYEKGLYFNETISRYEPGKLLVLDIKTDPAKIPVTVMDEHILIGGKHIDILQDMYSITPLNNGICRLSLSSHFFINTPFNWYAGIWANFLMNDILEEELHLVNERVTNRKQLINHLA